MKKLITILGLVSIIVAIVVEMNSNLIVDIKICAQDFSQELHDEPLTSTQREIISSRIAEGENAYLAEVNRKRNAAKIGVYSLLINGLILTSVGLMGVRQAASR